MATTYSWIISQLDCYPEHEGKQNVVFAIHWRRQAINNEHFADVYGEQKITLSPEAPFTPFDRLTKEQVETWLENAMTSEDLVNLTAILDSLLADKTSPSIVTPSLPWA